MQEESTSDAELDGLRIGQIARARGAAMRFSSYCVIGAAACGVGGVDLLWRALRRIEIVGVTGRPLLYLLATFILGWAGVKLFGKSRQLAREARSRSLPEPNIPPDFSGLSDGSHRVTNLEQIEE